MGWFSIHLSGKEDGPDNGKDDTKTVCDAIHYLLKDQVGFEIDVKGVCRGGDFHSGGCPYGCGGGGGGSVGRRSSSSSSRLQ